MTKHYGLVEKVAKRVARRLPRGVAVEDLMSSGAIGLMEAADRFDTERGGSFESFAEFRIRGAMLDDLRQRDTLSRDMRRISKELGKAATSLANQLGRTPDSAEIAHQMGISLDQMYARQKDLQGALVLGFDDAGPDLLERIGDGREEGPYEAAARREAFERLTDAIGALPQRMQQVLALYYAEGMNLKEIATILAVTESRVCQIHGEAVRRLRTKMELASEGPTAAA